MWWVDIRRRWRGDVLDSPPDGGGELLDEVVYFGVDGFEGCGRSWEEAVHGRDLGLLLVRLWMLLTSSWDSFKAPAKSIS